MHRLLQIKMTILPRGTILDTAHLQPGDLLFPNFDFFYSTSIPGLTAILIVVCDRTRMIWISTTA